MTDSLAVLRGWLAPTHLVARQGRVVQRPVLGIVVGTILVPVHDAGNCCQQMLVLVSGNDRICAELLRTTAGWAGLS